jgi:tyrosinase
VRSHLAAGVAEDWALPYWNYSDDPARRVLPPAFRERKLPNGHDNPLFVVERQKVPVDINRGDPMPGVAVGLTAAMAERVFSRPRIRALPGFGGGRTRPLFHHSGGGPAGPLEITPHGAVHVQVGGSGGLMTRSSGFTTRTWIGSGRCGDEGRHPGRTRPTVTGFACSSSSWTRRARVSP